MVCDTAPRSFIQTGPRAGNLMCMGTPILQSKISGHDFYAAVVFFIPSFHPLTSQKLLTGINLQEAGPDPPLYKRTVIFPIQGRKNPPPKKMQENIKTKKPVHLLSQ